MHKEVKGNAFRRVEKDARKFIEFGLGLAPTLGLTQQKQPQTTKKFRMLVLSQALPQNENNLTQQKDPINDSHNLCLRKRKQADRLRTFFFLCRFQFRLLAVASSFQPVD